MGGDHFLSGNLTVSKAWDLYLGFSNRFEIWQAFRQFKLAFWWRHIELGGVSNHRCLDCLLNPLIRSRSRKHQSSSSLTFVRGIQRSPLDSPHKGPVTRKMFPADDVIIPRYCLWRLSGTLRPASALMMPQPLKLSRAFVFWNPWILQTEDYSYFVLHCP